MMAGDVSVKTCLACGKPLIQRNKESPSAFVKRKNCNTSCAARSRGTERGEATTFRSLYGGGWIAAGQYLAEGMLARNARRDRRELPERFWENDLYKRDFLLQLRFAHALLKLYSVQAIIATLKMPEGKRAYTLSALWLDGLIARQQQRLDQEARLRQEASPASLLPPEAKNESPRSAYSPRPSPLKRLRDLDGQAEG